MDYLSAVYPNMPMSETHNRQEQVFTPVSRYGTQTEYIVELKRNLRNRNKRNPQQNETKTIVAFPLNKSETVHINNIELLVLVLVPKNIAKFSTTENKQTGGSRQQGVGCSMLVGRMVTWR